MTTSKKPKLPKPPEHFDEYLGRIRQWIDGFEAAGKQGPVNKDVLRQIQIWLRDNTE